MDCAKAKVAVPLFNPNNTARENNQEANEVSRGANKMSDAKSLSHRINNLACDIAEEFGIMDSWDNNKINRAQKILERKLSSWMLSYQENLLKKDS